MLEGIRAVDDALALGAHPRLIAVRADLARALPVVLPAGVPVRVFTPHLFNEIAGTEHPQGLLAVLPFPDLPVQPSAAALTLVADRVRDPGNLGTLLRSAAAGGVDEVLIAAETVDPFNPKSVRAGMGAHLRVPVRQTDDDDLAAALHEHEVVAIADADGEIEYDRLDWTRSVAIVIGGEAEGPSIRSARLATVRVRIPLERGVESLNAGVAGSLLIFEAARQRRRALRNG